MSHSILHSPTIVTSCNVHFGTIANGFVTFQHFPFKSFGWTIKRIVDLSTVHPSKITKSAIRLYVCTPRTPMIPSWFVMPKIFRFTTILFEVVGNNEMDEHPQGTKFPKGTNVNME
jgi:hypothetical protein